MSNRGPDQKMAKRLAGCLMLAVGFTAMGLQSCSTESEEGSEVKTQLGASGNQAVARRYNDYVASGVSCQNTGSGKHVLVTGFGLFSGVDYNISGVVVSSFADPSITSGTIDTDSNHASSDQPQAASAVMMSSSVASGRLVEVNKGARVSQRSMTINGQAFEICFLTLDVQWDLAAAIIIHEAEIFKPAMILMSGRGAETANFEGGALNRAMGLSGFTWSGAAHTDNTPQANYILLGRPMKSYMTWNSAQLAAATSDLVAANGFQVASFTGPRSDNTYICNNTSFVVLEAVKGAPISLAGGYLRLSPQITGSPKTGFFHFPAAADNSPDHIANWIKVLATAIDTTL